MMRRARLQFWLLAMDACHAVGLFGRAPYLFCVERASDCIDWGPSC